VEYQKMPIEALKILLISYSQRKELLSILPRVKAELQSTFKALI
jgi:hypothetical protein